MQIFLIILGIIILFIFVEPIFEDVFNQATILGSAIGAVPLSIGIMYNRLNARLTAILLVGFAFLLVILTIGMTIVFIKGKTTATNQDTLLILGCSVKGMRPSLSLKKRVDAAYDYLRKNKNAIAILSGGQGPDEEISEAECMLSLLTEKGIDKKRLLIEDKSTSTDENIGFSKKHFTSNEIAVATSEYHQLRAKAICKKHGVNAYAVSSRTKLTILPTFLLRELAALTVNKIRRSIRK